jgi:hypothetical protein
MRATPSSPLRNLPYRALMSLDAHSNRGNRLNFSLLRLFGFVPPTSDLQFVEGALPDWRSSLAVCVDRLLGHS